MNYVVMLFGMVVGFAQTKQQAEKMKPDLPGAAIYRAASILDEINGESVVVLFGREYCLAD